MKTAATQAFKQNCGSDKEDGGRSGGAFPGL